MKFKTVSLLCSPDADSSGGFVPNGDPAAADATVNSFLESLQSGALADEVYPEERPTEQLVNEDGKPPAQAPAPMLQTVPREKLEAVESPASETPSVPQTVPGRPAAQQLSTQRDYTGYTPDEVAILKQMSNPAFVWASGLLKARKAEAEQLAKQQEEFTALKQSNNKWLFEHEEAYTLSPEYRQQASTVNRLDQEANHWKQQLIRVKNGQPVHDLLIDDKGNLSVSPEGVEASPEVEAQILQNMQLAGQHRQTALARLNTWKGEHTSKFQAYRQRISGLETQLFPQGVPDPLKPEIDKALTMFPPELRSDPMVRNLSIAKVLIGGYQARVAELEQQLAGKQVVKQVVKQQGPGGGTPAVTTAAKGLTVNDELERLKAVRY